MSAYMLFADGAMPTDASTITERYGIQEIEANADSLTWIYCQNGPNGVPGMLGFWIDHDSLKANTYSPDGQKWTKLSLPLEGLSLGTFTADPLKPSDVLRAKPFEKSLSCRLEDNQLWQVPVARWLPHVWGQDAKGSFVRQPADAYTSFCEQAEQVFQYFVEAVNNAGNFEIECQWSFVCQALSLNYRLCPAIISALKLIGDHSGGRILAATIEMQLTRDVEDQKKS